MARSGLKELQYCLTSVITHDEIAENIAIQDEIMYIMDYIIAVLRVF